MGYEPNKRIVKEVNSRRVTAAVGGQKCYFRSILEYRWALYLQWLREQKQILYWAYEPFVYDFTSYAYETGPYKYRPDFLVCEMDKTKVIQECKGYHDGATNRKFQRTLKHFPDVIFELVLQRIPKNRSKGAARRHTASRYVRRIIDASEIFNQMRCMIDFRVPKK